MSQLSNSARDSVLSLEMFFEDAIEQLRKEHGLTVDSVKFKYKKSMEGNNMRVTGMKLILSVDA
jgi:hypothetical protein